MIIGARGFIAWLETGMYIKIRERCKNIFVRICVHAVGLLLVTGGLYFLIAAMPSMTSVAGLFLNIIGLFIFCIPLGMDETSYYSNFSSRILIIPWLASTEKIIKKTSLFF